MNRSHIVSRRSTFPLLGLFLAMLSATTPARVDGGSVLNTPPAKPVRIPAEFEPMQAVAVNWPDVGDPSFYKRLAEDVRLILLWESTSDYERMRGALSTYGVDLDRCEFYKVLRVPIMRDGMPWFLFTDHNEPAFVYNAPASSSYAIPPYGPAQGYPVYRSGLEVQGGAFMTDGQGTAVSLDLVAAKHAKLGDKFRERVRDYWGVQTYHFVAAQKGQGQYPHIDCLAKFLSPDTIMVARVASSDVHHECSEEAAAYFRRQVTCYGTPCKVVRVDSPDDEPYINSLIVNRRVFVPILNRAADANALASYEAAMPGYEVIGVRSSGSTEPGVSFWEPFWALHCDTMGIADEQMLYIRHTPLLDRPPASQGFPIRAEIEAFSGTEFVDGTPVVLWRARADANDAPPPAPWNTAAMARDPESGDRQYLAYIPAQPAGTVIQYYLQAKDASGRDETHPYIGEPQAHTFTVTALGANVSAVSARRGGTVEFSINLGVDNAGQAYRLAYSVLVDPNAPGSPGPALPATAVPAGFDGALDEFGIAAPRLTFPEPLASEWIGRVLHFSLELGNRQNAMPGAVTIAVLE